MAVDAFVLLLENLLRSGQHAVLSPQLRQHLALLLVNSALTAQLVDVSLELKT